MSKVMNIQYTVLEYTFLTYLILWYVYLVFISEIGTELELLYPLMFSIHKPYSHAMLQYPSLEQRQLLNKLQKIKIVRLCACVKIILH